jgi:ABC-2 type transport system ATP-binding protein
VAIVNGGRVLRAGSLDELVGPAVEVEIRADGLTDEMVAALARWGDVTNRSADRLTLTTPDEDGLPEVTRYLVESGARVRAVAPRRTSLEELFVREVRDA